MKAAEAIKRLGEAGIVPVVVMEEAERAVPVAKAMLAGGIDVMEITFRTAAAADAIRAVAEQCPGMLVGAGTVITLDQCRAAAEAVKNESFEGNRAYMIFRTAQLGLKQKLKEMIEIYGSQDQAWSLSPAGLPQVQFPKK